MLIETSGWKKRGREKQGGEDGEMDDDRNEGPGGWKAWPAVILVPIKAWVLFTFAASFFLDSNVPIKKQYKSGSNYACFLNSQSIQIDA